MDKIRFDSYNRMARSIPESMPSQEQLGPFFESEEKRSIRITGHSNQPIFNATCVVGASVRNRVCIDCSQRPGRPFNCTINQAGKLKRWLNGRGVYAR